MLTTTLGNAAGWGDDGQPPKAEPRRVPKVMRKKPRNRPKGLRKKLRR